MSASRPTPKLEDQVSVFMTPGDRVAQLYLRTLGSPFTWAPEGLSGFSPKYFTIWGRNMDTKHTTGE
jgi:hypothetical protein